LHVEAGLLLDTNDRGMVRRATTGCHEGVSRDRLESARRVGTPRF
jgi:hypothetical protein